MLLVRTEDVGDMTEETLVKTRNMVTKVDGEVHVTKKMMWICFAVLVLMRNLYVTC